jgi:pimeloyl-ACP methyl ester carboxylesterase
MIEKSLTGRPVRLDVDVTEVAPPGARFVAADLFPPSGDWTDPPIAVCCLPGGGMSRRYFDVTGPDIDGYSMARYLADHHGLWVITIDHLGVGGSSRPDDGYALTPRAIADTNAYVCTRLLDGLRAGTVDPNIPPVPGLRSIGVGHSMGGMLTVYQQAQHRTHDALGLLGFSGNGLPAVLTEEEARLANAPDQVEGAIASLVATRFGRPLPGGSTSDSDFLIAGVSVPAARAALARNSSALLALAGLTSMIPGSSRPQLAAIDVPVFFGLGERDIAGSIADLPAQVPSCRDITLFVLAGSGHNHNIADNRADLWHRLATWIRSVVGG